MTKDSNAKRMQEGLIHRKCEFLSQRPFISTHITNRRTAWLTYYAPGRLRNKMGRDYLHEKIGLDATKQFYYLMVGLWTLVRSYAPCKVRR